MSDRSHRARVRETRLREHGYDTYSAYLKSPAWRNVKLRYRASDLPQVCMCGETKVDLHHTTYERVGRELLEDLVPLCRACHTQAHELEAAGLIDLDLKGFYYDLHRAYAYAGPERLRKAQAAADFAVKEHKAHDTFQAARRDGLTYAKEQHAKRGRNMRLRIAMYAAADPDALAKRRARIFKEAQAQHLARCVARKRNAPQPPRQDYRPSAIPMS